LGAPAIAAAQRVENAPPATLKLTAEQRSSAAALVERYRPVADFGVPEPAPLLRGEPIRELSVVSLPSGAIISTTSPLVISPATSLDQNQALRNDISRLLGERALGQMARPPSSTWLQIGVPPARTLNALRLSEAYSSTLRLINPLAVKVDHANIPGYQTLTIKQGIP